jgi:hypothetical protein
MATNYLTVLAKCFPGAEAWTAGNPTIYEDLIWVTPPIDKATLDSTDCAQDLPVNIGEGIYTAYAAGGGTGFYYGTVPFLSGTTKFSSGDVVPPHNEGSEVWSVNITPNTTPALFTISFALQIDSSKAMNVLVAIFRDDILVGASMRYCSGSDKPGNVHLQFTDRVDSPDPFTYSARIGKIGRQPGTWYLNRSKTMTADGSLQQHFVILENEG